MEGLGKILLPHEAIPLLLDGDRCPLVGIDTEFDENAPACKADLHGVGIAGCRPGYGEAVATFFPFLGSRVKYPWDFVFRQVLLPVFRDARRTVVMHPPKVDMQPLRARGLREEDIVCKIEDTMSMLHIFDENLPKGLKDVGESLLGVQGLLTYKQMKDASRKLEKAGMAEVRKIMGDCWDLYKAERRKSKEEAVPEDLSLPSWKRLVMALPPKMLKADVLVALRSIIEPVVMGRYREEAERLFTTYGALDPLLTLGIRNLMMLGIPGIVDPIPTESYPLLALETSICHPVTTEMEEAGARLDLVLMSSIERALRQAIAELEVRVMSQWAPSHATVSADPFNPSSSDQVAVIVWTVWGTRPPPWTMRDGSLTDKYVRKKDGLCSTKDEVLDYLAKRDEVHGAAIRDILDYRALTKLHGTYAVPLIEYATKDPEQRVHSSFWHVGTKTGRYSSSNPNLENIPRPDTMPVLGAKGASDKDEPPTGTRAAYDKDDNFMGWRVRSIRDAFVAPQGYMLVSVDLSQIENRLIAHESQDPTLLHLYRDWDCGECGKSGSTTKALHTCPECGAGSGKRNKQDPKQPVISGFCLGRDIHSQTAHALGLVGKYPKFDIARSRAKGVNHGYNYGMGANTLAMREGFTIRQAREYLEGMNSTYPYVREVLHARVRKAVSDYGYVTVFDGHVRKLFWAKALMDSRIFCEWEWEGVIREAVNVLAQGGTAVIMKKAMLTIRGRLKKKALDNPLFSRVKLINQVHDEIVYETPEPVAEEVRQIVTHELENAVELSVPILAEGACGRSWGEAH